jgi:uncharacterized cupredoxin-like copper-binding protein
MKSLSILAALAATAALALTASALGTPAATTVKVSATELKFALVPKTAKKGAVVFQVTNRGKLPHDFKIAGKKTAVLKPGKAAKLSVTFKKAGRFPYLCTVPGHAAGGMKGVLVVK